MTKFLDLKPDKILLDPNFQSYRLALDPLPVLEKSLEKSVEVIELRDDQFGYLHAHLLSFVNHLIPDPYSLGNVFYVNETREIIFNKLSAEGRFSDQRIVWKFPYAESKDRGNVTITFADTEWAVVSDGYQKLFILRTPSRDVGEPWQLLHIQIMNESRDPCLILDAVHCTFPCNEQLDCLLTYVQRSQEMEGAPFECLLEWITLSCVLGKESDWTVKRTRKLTGPSAPLYAALESSSFLVLASEKEFRFIFDSEKPIMVPVIRELKEPQPPLYTYIQNNDEIAVMFKLPENSKKTDISVDIRMSLLEVKVLQDVVLSGKLFDHLDTSGSTWTIEGNKLELSLSKANPGLGWKELVIGDRRGEELLDPALAEEVHQRLAHLTSDKPVLDDTQPPAFDPQQLEECDISMDQLVLQRLDGDLHTVTHQDNLGGYQWLFKVSRVGESLPAFCTRYDVDGVVWQPSGEAGDAWHPSRDTGDGHETFSISHCSTFPALGYVLASKQDRKFVVCSPDFSYSVVCDSGRHVYIYRQPESLHKDLELRNRKTGRGIEEIAKQHVVSLENCDAIVGLHASEECIYVLATKRLYAIKVKQE